MALVFQFRQLDVLPDPGYGRAIRFTEDRRGHVILGRQTLERVFAADDPDGEGDRSQQLGRPASRGEPSLGT
jgi:hypothetical protein